MSPRLAATATTTLLTSLAAGAAVRAGDGGFAPYTEVPRVYAQDSARWVALFERGFTQTLRLALIGDSQETCPVGSGRAYVPALNHELYKVFGNCPETPLVSHRSAAGTPSANPAGWLWGALGGLDRGAPTRIPAAMIPPGLEAKAMTGIPPQSIGWLYVLYHDAEDIVTGVVPAGIPYLDSAAEIRAEIVAATNPSSGEVSWRARPTSDQPAFTAPVSGSGVATMGLEEPGPPQFRTALTPPLSYDNERWMVVESFGSSSTKLTDVLGLRYRNVTRPDGAVLQTLSESGMTFDQLLAQHAEMGAALAALDFDAFLVQLGVNDAFTNHTAQQYHDDLLTLIALLRGAYGDPALPVIAVTEVHRADGPPSMQAQFDRQAGAAMAIAEADPNVLVLNLRRITEEEYGWGPADESFLEDIVHLTNEAQVQLAEAAISSLFEGIGFPPVCPDVTGDGAVNIDDVTAIVLGWGSADPTLDVTGDGTVGIDDLVLAIVEWGACPPVPGR